MSLEEEEKASSTSTSGELRVSGIQAFHLVVDHTHPDLQSQINKLKSTLERLTLEVSQIRDMIEVSPVRVRIVEAREVSMKEAKGLILEYMETHEVVYPDDVADELGLDLKIAIEAVNELIKEGKIKETKET